MKWALLALASVLASLSPSSSGAQDDAPLRRQRRDDDTDDGGFVDVFCVPEQQGKDGQMECLAFLYDEEQQQWTTTSETSLDSSRSKARETTAFIVPLYPDHEEGAGSSWCYVGIRPPLEDDLEQQICRAPSERPQHFQCSARIPVALRDRFVCVPKEFADTPLPTPELSEGKNNLAYLVRVTCSPVVDKRGGIECECSHGVPVETKYVSVAEYTSAVECHITHDNPSMKRKLGLLHECSSSSSPPLLRKCSLMWPRRALHTLRGIKVANETAPLDRVLDAARKDPGVPDLVKITCRPRRGPQGVGWCECDQSVTQRPKPGLERGPREDELLECRIDLDLPVTVKQECKRVSPPPISTSPAFLLRPQVERHPDTQQRPGRFVRELFFRHFQTFSRPQTSSRHRRSGPRFELPDPSGQSSIFDPYSCPRLSCIHFFPSLHGMLECSVSLPKPLLAFAYGRYKMEAFCLSEDCLITIAAPLCRKECSYYDRRFGCVENVECSLCLRDLRGFFPDAHITERDCGHP